MDNKQNILSLLGLCLRGNHLAVGEEPVEAVARARDARVLLLASDAADNTMRRVRHFAEVGQCIWLRVPFTKAELGRSCGRSAAAVVAVTDIGLANTVVHRLAELDPVHYDEAAAKLELKAQRAAERRSEQAQHEKNLRKGLKKKKDEPAPAPVKEVKSSRVEKKSDEQRPFRKSRPSRDNRRRNSRVKENPYAHSRPVKKGKGSFRKKEV